MLLSIIIPAYNAGKYLEECLTSCCSQDLSQASYEIIVVNDGSSDNTEEIALRWAAEQNNIKVISQSNKGLSEARNAGIESAEGTYLMFVDSDDTISINCLRQLTDMCRMHSPDMLRFCAADIIAGKAQRRFSYKDCSIVPGREIIKTKFQVCAPFSLYNKDFLKRYSLRFHPSIFHEDNEFTPRAYYLADKVMSINNIIYFVRQTPMSITRHPNPKRCSDLLQVAVRLVSFAEQNVEKGYKNEFSRLAANCVNWCFQIMRELPEEYTSPILEKIRNRKVYLDCFSNSSSILHKVEGMLLKNFPGNMMAIYRILDLIHYKKRKKSRTYLYENNPENVK